MELQVGSKDALPQIMLARYYGNSNTFRFLSTDPGDDTYLDKPQSWNKYSYVRNNPIAFADPTGMKMNLARPLAATKLELVIHGVPSA